MKPPSHIHHNRTPILWTLKQSVILKLSSSTRIKEEERWRELDICPSTLTAWILFQVKWWLPLAKYIVPFVSHMLLLFFALSHSRRSCETGSHWWQADSSRITWILRSQKLWSHSNSYWLRSWEVYDAHKTSMVHLLPIAIDCGDGGLRRPHDFHGPSAACAVNIVPPPSWVSYILLWRDERFRRACSHHRRRHRHHAYRGIRGRRGPPLTSRPVLCRFRRGPGSDTTKCPTHAGPGSVPPFSRRVALLRVLFLDFKQNKQNKIRQKQ